MTKKEFDSLRLGNTIIAKGREYKISDIDRNKGLVQTNRTWRNFRTVEIKKNNI